MLSEIKRNNDNFSLLTSSVTDLHVEIAKLQIKAGVWGLMGGLIPILVTMVIYCLK